MVWGEAIGAGLSLAGTVQGMHDQRKLARYMRRQYGLAKGDLKKGRQLSGKHYRQRTEHLGQAYDLLDENTQAALNEGSLFGAGERMRIGDDLTRRLADIRGQLGTLGSSSGAGALMRSLYSDADRSYADLGDYRARLMSSLYGQRGSALAGARGAQAASEASRGAERYGQYSDLANLRLGQSGSFDTGYYQQMGQLGGQLGQLVDQGIDWYSRWRNRRRGGGGGGGPMFREPTGRSWDFATGKPRH